jgi:mannose-6-phosphate isomerase-like protein (cupin superfamily)
MPRLIERPASIAAAGRPAKRIDEYLGRIRSQQSDISLARMRSPAGWREPAQTPEFEEITLVLAGMLRLEHAGGATDVHAGQAVVVAPGERIRYSSPSPEGADYVAICRPAFSPERVHRDGEGAGGAG